MKSILNSNRKIALALAIVLLLGLILRLSGRGWDQGLYLNPDERFLVMTATALKWPNSFSQYLNPQTSPLNPYNIDVGFFFFWLLPFKFGQRLGYRFSKRQLHFFLSSGQATHCHNPLECDLGGFLNCQTAFFKTPKTQANSCFSPLVIHSC